MLFPLLASSVSDAAQRERLPLVSKWLHCAELLLPSPVETLRLDPVSAPTWKIFSESLFRTFITQSLARWTIVGD